MTRHLHARLRPIGLLRRPLLLLMVVLFLIVSPSGCADFGVVCVDTATDPAHCGTCANACAQGFSCVMGVCAAPLCNGRLGFPAPPDVPVGAGAEYVAPADLNGDGKLDLVTLDGKVTVVLNTGNGTFAAPVSYSGALQTPTTSVAVGDLNGDGKPDLALVSAGVDFNNNWSIVVSTLLNTSNGSFGASTGQLLWMGVLPVGAKASASIAVADLNGDGKLDIAVVNNNTAAKVSVLLNAGNGTFASPVDVGAVGGVMAVGDLNGDGKPDIALAGMNRVNVLLNAGNGTFGAPVSSAVGVTPVTPSSVALADLDGDGKPDLAMANGTIVSAVLNTGSGTFAPAVNYAAGVAPTSVSAADLNGDGKPDIAVADSGGGVDVLLNAGNGTFAAPVGYVVGANPSFVTVGDLDGDGKPDVLVPNRYTITGAGVSVLLNTGNGTFPDRVDTAALGDTVKAADLNGDGKPDLITFGASDVMGAHINVLLNTGNGTFASPDDYVVAPSPPLPSCSRPWAT